MNDSKGERETAGEADSTKLGIALSGGGFRAAFFHIGVLARLAEQDMLRRVAVISCVSGGSIIGAFYYLKVKQLLEGKRGDKLSPSRESYCQLVAEIEREFTLAVQLNIRMLTFADQRENARMLAGRTSPTKRVGTLLDEHFYAPITGRSNNLLRDLPIEVQTSDGVTTPAGTVAPRLILNSTALNTGHLFQFTGTYIGESPIFSVLGGTHSMPQLPRLHFDDASLTEQQRHRLGQITLGEAVTASSCVPGLLDPLSLDGLYRDQNAEPVQLGLVDGGVFDNQGLVSLFEENCTHYVCSDASDLLQWQSVPPNLIHNVALRANDIFMDRIRISILRELEHRGEENFAVFTLGSATGSDIFGNDAEAFLAALRGIRTDLDAFSDMEAWSLMYHGYAVSESQLSSLDRGHEAEEHRHNWDFRTIRAMAVKPDQREELLHHLRVGSHPFLKVFYLHKMLPWAIAILPSLIPLSVTVVAIYLLPPIPTPAWVVIGLMALTAITYMQNARIIAWLDQVEAFKRTRKKLAKVLEPLGITMILGLVGAVASWVNLRIFNPLFLRYGRLRERK
jgi:hypothetical protein